MTTSASWQMSRFKKASFLKQKWEKKQQYGAWMVWMRWPWTSALMQLWRLCRCSWFLKGRSQPRTLYSTLHKQVKLTDVQTEMMATGYTSASRGAAEHGGAGGRGATDEDKCCCLDCVELGINSQQQRYGSCLLKMLPMAAQGCALAMTAILLALIELQDVDEEGCQWEEKKKVSRGFLSVRGQMLGTSYNRVVSHTRTHTRARAHRQRERFKQKAALPGLSWRPFKCFLSNLRGNEFEILAFPFVFILV